MTTDPGATPIAARAVAPDLARGGMLLLIALANVHLYLYDRPTGLRGYPSAIEGADRLVTVIQLILVDGRAYPLFGFLFGYGIVQLAWRRGALGMPASAVTALVRRRGRWMILIGALHGVLLWSGDIVGAYGLLAVLMAGLLVAGSERRLLVVGIVGVLLVTLLYTGAAVPMPGAETQSLLPSMAIAAPGPALLARAGEWIFVGFLVQALGVFAAVALGARAARRRLLDEPARHEALLRKVAVGGVLAAVLGGLPLALATAGIWVTSSVPALLLAGGLHALSGYAGGLGYAALFALLAIRIADQARPGPVVRAVQACGQRSLSCYLAQSVAFVALLPAWTLGWGAQARIWQTALLAVGAWLVILLIAAWSERMGYRGPAEVLLRRLTYSRTGGALAR